MFGESIKTSNAPEDAARSQSGDPCHEHRWIALLRAARAGAQPPNPVLGDYISRAPESRRSGAMSDYGLPERIAKSGDVISAWVLYAVIIFAMIAFSTIYESLSTRPDGFVENSIFATDEDILSNQNLRSVFVTVEPFDQSSRSVSCNAARPRRHQAAGTCRPGEALWMDNE